MGEDEHKTVTREELEAMIVENMRDMTEEQKQKYLLAMARSLGITDFQLWVYKLFVRRQGEPDEQGGA